MRLCSKGIGWQVILWDIGFNMSIVLLLQVNKNRSLFACWKDGVEGCKRRPEVFPRAVEG